VTDLGRRLDAQPQARLVPETVLRTVADSLHLDGAALRGAGILDASIGEPAGSAAEFPVVYQGEQLAVLAVAPRRGETELTDHDRRVLRLLAVHAAPALHGARALHELTATHSRMLLAREEERRRLRRDLHDDLSPTLAGLRLGAAAVARRAAAADPELARLAADLQDDIAGAVDQTREIAYGLRPEILDDLGLVAAIAGRIHGPDELDVRIDAPADRLELPAAVDLAALRIVQEAVSNVRRHAGATRCTVALALDDDTLTVRVTDDGIGLPARLRPGIGLTSIRERATELGGTVEFGAADGGGSRVDVRLPAGRAS
jgi:signal transduction histidine kinase